MVLFWAKENNYKVENNLLIIAIQVLGGIGGTIIGGNNPFDTQNIFFSSWNANLIFLNSSTYFIVLWRNSFPICFSFLFVYVFVLRMFLFCLCFCFDNVSFAAQKQIRITFWNIIVNLWQIILFRRNIEIEKRLCIIQPCKLKRF